MRNFLTELGPSDKPRYAWFRCVCGEIVEKRRDQVRSGRFTSCGCDCTRPVNLSMKKDPLYAIYTRYKLNRKWETFFDFRAEIGLPDPSIDKPCVVPIVPGTEVGPGNVRWGRNAQYIFDLTEEQQDMHHEQFQNESNINDYEQELYVLDDKDPNSWEHSLENIRSEFAKLRTGDEEEWQREIERQATAYAIEERKRAEEATYQSRRSSQTQVGRLFRYQLVNCLAELLEEWHKGAMVHGAGRFLATVDPLLKKGLDYMTVAHITVTVVMDKLGRNSAFQSTITKIKVEIGQKLDHQAFLNTIEAHFPREFDKINRWYLKSGEMGYAYKIGNAKKTIQDELKYDFLSPLEQMHVGDWAFTCLERLTKWFEREDVPNEGKHGVTAYLKLSEEGIKHRMMLQSMADAAEFDAWPMVCKPLDWTPEERGGYMLQHPGDYGHLIHNDHGTIPSVSAFDAINKQQSVPFKVNRFVYDVQVALLSKHNEIGAFKSYEADSWVDENFPRFDPEVWELPKMDPAHRKAKRDLKRAYSAQKKAEKLGKNPFRVLKVAARFLEVPKIYLSCFFDSRLRIYTHSVTLTYQGSDYQKALIMFAEGNPVTDENREQVKREMLISIANSYGNDKISFDDRVEFAADLLNGLDFVAAEPLSTKARNIWADAADEPFQFLALVREYFEIFVWHTKDVAEVPGGRDATNSGNQILGAMCRDAKTCFYTNVITEWKDQVADAPQDLYGVVARGVQVLLNNDNYVHTNLEKYRESALKKADKEGYEIKLDNFTYNPRLISIINRSHVKRACMIDAYGGAWRSKNRHISDELTETGKELDIKFSLAEKRLVTDACVASQASSFPLSDQLNKWFKGFGQAAVKKGLKLINWTTPDGSYVVQEYLVPNMITIDTYAMGGGTYFKPLEQPGEDRPNAKAKDKRQSASIRNGYTDEIMEGKTATALGANFTHSHDASIIRGAMNKLEHSFFGVHDCLYAPHGHLEEACKQLRLSFRDCVSGDALSDLAKSNELEVASAPRGDADIKDCTDSPYMFS